MDNENSIQQSHENALTLYLDILRRRQAIVIQTFIVVLAVGIIVTFLTKPLYKTSSKILVEGKSLIMQTGDLTNPLTGLYQLGAGHDVDTQLEVLQGDKVLAETYTQAGIPPDSVTLDVKQNGMTDVIEITASSNVRDYAQKFANAIPVIYRKYITGNRSAEVKSALEFAEKQLKLDTTALNAAEAKLNDFHKNSHILNEEQNSKERETKRVDAETERDRGIIAVAGMQARLITLLAQRRTMKPEIVTHSASTNPELQALHDQMETLKSERAKELLLYKAGSLEIKTLDLQISSLQARIAKTPSMVANTKRDPNIEIVNQDAKLAQTYTELAEEQAKLENLRKVVAANTTDIDKNILLQRRQARLEREIVRYENSVGVMQKSVDDLKLRQQVDHDPITVISPAGKAEQVAPRRLNNLLIAAGAGLVLALAFALIQELLDDGVNSPDDSRKIMGVPVLGFIPLVEDPQHVLLGDSPGGTLLETYRVLRTNVRFSAVDAPIRSLVVTSTLSGEGKSVTVHNLAVAMALDGRRVIIVDTDLRRPTQHKYSNIERSPGLTNILVAGIPLEEALQPTQMENLRILTTGPLPPNPTELLNSQAMAKFHEEVRELCDIVIYDTSPCLVAADAQILASAVDGVLYVAQFGVTKRSLLRRSTELLQQAQARVLGTVFNKIDLRARRDDYYYGYYRYYKYYRDDANSLGVEGNDKHRRSYREFEALLQSNSNGSSSETNGHSPSDYVAVRESPASESHQTDSGESE